MKLALSTAYPACPERATRVEGSAAEWVEWISAVKIGKILMKNQSKTLIPQNKNQNYQKIFNLLSQIELRATSDKKRLNFRNKRAGSSNYRGSVFLLPEFTPGVCLLAFLSGAIRDTKY